MSQRTFSEYMRRLVTSTSSSSSSSSVTVKLCVLICHLSSSKFIDRSDQSVWLPSTGVSTINIIVRQSVANETVCGIVRNRNNPKKCHSDFIKGSKTINTEDQKTTQYFVDGPWKNGPGQTPVLLLERQINPPNRLKKTVIWKMTSHLHVVVQLFVVYY
jgi:hypothetical protein